jgi:hypothetical protein
VAVLHNFSCQRCSGQFGHASSCLKFWLFWLAHASSICSANPTPGDLQELFLVISHSSATPVPSITMLKM